MSARRACLWVLTGAGLALCLGSPRSAFTYNPTASAPLGLYRLATPAHLQIGDWVVSRLPPDMRALAAARRYLPATVPVLKTVAGRDGDTVCSFDAVIRINGAIVAAARAVDHADRPLPTWEGCRRLHAGQVFLLNRAAASFDGRYFGPTAQSLIIAKAVPVWTR